MAAGSSTPPYHAVLPRVGGQVAIAAVHTCVGCGYTPVNSGKGKVEGVRPNHDLRNGWDNETESPPSPLDG